MTQRGEVSGVGGGGRGGEVGAGVEPLDQRRVSIVCRATRVDLTLPAHLELVSVIPEVVDHVRHHVRTAAGPGSTVDVDARMGGGTGGSWQMSRLAGGPLAVSETLAQQRVHDGEILVLDHRPVPAPAPLFDDVLQGLTEPGVARSPAWDRRDAARAATATVGVAAAAAAVALTVQWSASAGPITPVVSLVLALFGLAAVIALRRTEAPGISHAVAGACAVGFTVLAAGSVAPPPIGPGALFGAFTAGSAMAAALRWTVFRPAPGTYGLAAGYLGVTISLGTGAVGAAAVAVSGAAVGAVGAGAVLVGLLLLTSAPRIAVSAARIPIPPVPTPGEDVPDGDLEEIDHDLRGRVDPGAIAGGRTSGAGTAGGQLPTPEVLRHRFLSSRSWLTGMLGAAGTICTAGALFALAWDGSGSWSAPLALVLVVVLLLRGLGYSDRVHTAVLLSAALVLTAGVLVGAALISASPVGVVVPAAVAVAAAVVVAIWVLPHVDLSPATLRAVGVVEVLAVCLLVPLAVGAMDVYSLVRQR